MLNFKYKTSLSELLCFQKGKHATMFTDEGDHSTKILRKPIIVIFYNFLTILRQKFLKVFSPGTLANAQAE